MQAINSPTLEVIASPVAYSGSHCKPGCFFVAPYEGPKILKDSRFKVKRRDKMTYISSKECYFYICTCQAKLSVLTLRHTSSLSAAGQAQRAKWPDPYISSQAGVLTLRHINSLSAPKKNGQIKAGRFDIAPYEQFISGCPSPERSQMTRSRHEPFIRGWPSSERSKMTRSLHFEA